MPVGSITCNKSGHALVEHGPIDQQKAYDIGTSLDIARVPVLRGGKGALFVDGIHDALELGVDLLPSPGIKGRVLGHLQRCGPFHQHRGHPGVIID